MFNEIEQLENEISEFRNLIKSSVDILSQMEKNTADIQIMEPKLESGLVHIHSIEQNMKILEEETKAIKDDVAHIKSKIKVLFAIALIGLVAGIGSIVMNFIG